MRYKNTKTGAVIDSPFKITGDNWEIIDTEGVLYNQKGEVISGDQEVPEEFIEEEINLEEMTNRQLEEFAKEHKIELSTNDKRNKSTRIEAIAKAFE